MSDFIYSKKLIEKGILTNEIQRIYQKDKPSVIEFHGYWGSLAVSENQYTGFQPYENDQHICIVIGGPVLEFAGNEFLQSDSKTTGTQRIYRHWYEENMEWDEDLSGPYTILFIDKKKSSIFCITDLLSFIPVYKYEGRNNIMLATHADVLASAGDKKNDIDIISQVDFILNGSITYPYTNYKEVYQLAPSSIHFIEKCSNNVESQHYWLPEEKVLYNSINDAANDLRKSLKKYVMKVSSGMPHIAQFISGGEDSRVLSSLLPSNSQREAFIFLDYLNREGVRAKKAADAYGANFNLATRSNMHYLEILSPCVDLVGSGSQFTHAHTFKFHKNCDLHKYSAVFGGLFSDALLKGSHIKKARGIGRLPFLPQIKRSDYSAANLVENSFFKADVLLELTKRRQSHLKNIKRFRNESAEEWFELWPSSMNINLPNLHTNRRLFSSYEPFTSKDVVKISASVPQKWKLNRRLFHKAVKPLLKQTKWLLHSDGRLPYFPWYINSFLQFCVWGYQQVGSRIGLIRGNQDSWANWKMIVNSKEWERENEKYADGISVISHTFNQIESNIQKISQDAKLNVTQQVNLLQILYTNKKIEN